MSLTAKIMAVLSLFWVILWGWGCWPLTAPSQFHIFVFAITPVVLGWLIRAGCYSSFKKNNTTQAGADTKDQFSLPVAATFKNPVRLTKWVTTFLAIEVFLLGLFCVLKWVDLKSLQLAHSPGMTFLLLFLCLAFVIIPLVAVVMKFMWIYKTNFNTHQLGVANLSYSPRSAVGWTIVPFGIYYTMKEICKSNWYQSLQWKDQPSPLLFKLWWSTFLANLFVFIIFFWMPKSAASLGSVLFYLCMIANEILFIMLINKLANKQILAHRSSGVA